MASFYVCMKLLVFIFSYAAYVQARPQGSTAPILLANVNQTRPLVKPTRLVLFVPGGKVPPEYYTAFVQGFLDRSNTSLVSAIVHCGKLNLCNPLGQLNGLLAEATKAAAGLRGGVPFDPKDIFVFGHSLGGVGARHYVDTFKPSGASSFLGLALLGTQYNGDSENFNGTLGYPTNVTAFPIPLLMLLGELDKVPVSHAAIVYEQILQLPSAKDRSRKAVLVVPGMDHSQFCSPFNVSGDIEPEISNAEALRVASTLAAAWIDVVSIETNSVAYDPSQHILDYSERFTRPITAAFREARLLEQTNLCSDMQLKLIQNFPVSSQEQVGPVLTTVVDSSAGLEHSHTSFNLTRDGRLALLTVLYAYYPQQKSFNPVEILSPTYSGAKDISCKLVSADRIAQQLNVSGMYPEAMPNITCKKLNEYSVERARNLLELHYPAALNRFERRGRSFVYIDDESTFMGPQWAFLSALKFKPGKEPASSVQVQSPRLYSNIKSKIWPGNMYCKVLSPAKAVEWIQTTGLQGRFP